MTLIFIGLDDTDILGARGTGRLARQLAADLQHGAPPGLTVLGVTRHQLLVDPRIPYTSHNSGAVLHLMARDDLATGQDFLVDLFEHVRVMMLADFIPGSDPGLCLALEPAAQALAVFGRQAQTEIVTQEQARALAQAQGVLLAGLGGSQDGVIGALAGVGLAASGEDGRYLLVGTARELSGLQSPAAIQAAGIPFIQDEQGRPVIDGPIRADKLRPARRGGQPVLVARWDGAAWEPLKLD